MVQKSMTAHPSHDSSGKPKVNAVRKAAYSLELVARRKLYESHKNRAARRDDKSAAVFALGSGSKLKSKQGPPRRGSGHGRWGVQKNAANAHTLTGRGNCGEAATAPGGRGRRRRHSNRLRGALGFSPLAIRPVFPEASCGKIAECGGLERRGEGRRKVAACDVTFAHRRGAAMQPKRCSAISSVCIGVMGSDRTRDREVLRPNRVR